MKNLAGTKTEANLKAAYAGESQASMKYSYYAKQAAKDGYEQIGAIFTETAHNEHTHAKLWFKLLHGGSIPDTSTNLADAAAGEHYEWTDMYKTFAEEARAEGFDDIARMFEGVGAIEREHEERYQKMLSNLKEDIVFKSADGEIAWICRECGHIHVGRQAPTKCPVCSHPQAFFERRMINY